MEIAVALCFADGQRRRQPGAIRRGELHDANAGIFRYVHEVRVREMEIVVRYSPGEVVLQAIGHRKAIEPIGGDRIEISGPEGFIVVPGLIFEFGTEVAADAAHIVRRLLLHHICEAQSFYGTSPVTNAVRELEQSIDITSHVSSRYQKCGHAA